MNSPRFIAAWIRRLIPRNSPLLYRLSRRYLDLYLGEGNSDIRTNGELRLMARVLPHCKTVFDVGANAGNWSELASTINPNSAIHSFEPSAAPFQTLSSRGLPSAVVCNPFGLGAREEERTLFKFSESAGMNSLYRRKGLEPSHGLASQQMTEQVQLRRLDAYCRDHQISEIDYLKLDVEGHELEVLRGAGQMLADGAVNLVQFEYGGCNIDARVLLQDLFEYFQKYGFDLLKIYPDRLQPVGDYDQKLENFNYQNWIAARRDSRLWDLL